MTAKTSFEKFLDQFPPRKIKKGRTILYQGEVPRSMIYIKSGVVKIYDISVSGEEKIVAFCIKGDIMPVAWLFGKSSVSLYYFDAFTDVELHFLPRDTLRDYLHSDIDAMQQAMESYATLFMSSTLHIGALEQSKATDKIVHLLHHLSLRFGKEEKKAHKTIDLRLTHQELASMVGLTRETTAMELNKLKKNGVLTYHRQSYTVNMDKLVPMLGSEEFTKFHY